MMQEQPYRGQNLIAGHGYFHEMIFRLSVCLDNHSRFSRAEGGCKFTGLSAHKTKILTEHAFWNARLITTDTPKPPTRRDFVESELAKLAKTASQSKLPTHPIEAQGALNRFLVSTTKEISERLTKEIDAETHPMPIK